MQITNVDIPWLTHTQFPEKITGCFGQPDEVWDDHTGTDQLLPFSITVERLGNRVTSLQQRVAIRAHCIWGRALIHAIIREPSALKNIESIDLISPPIAMSDLTEYMTGDPIKNRMIDIIRGCTPLLFKWNFLESLQPDTTAINDRLINTLVNNNYSGVHMHFDPNDRFFRISRDDYEEQITNIVVAATPLIRVTKNSHGHNYERYSGEKSGF